MNNPFITDLNEGSPYSITGVESFKLGETFTNIVSEFSLGIDRKFALLKSALHVIDYARARASTNGLNFFDVNTKPMTVAIYWNPNSVKWQHYVELVLNGLPMITTLKDESSRFYDWLKIIAATGKVSRSFRYSITGYDDLISSTEDFLKANGVENKRRQFPILDVYGNFNEPFNLMERYNQNVKVIKGRDLELISKQLDQIKRMGDLVVQKIKNSDIVLNESDAQVIIDNINYFTRSVNVTGAIITLINELRDVFTQQCVEFSNLKK